MYQSTSLFQQGTFQLFVEVLIIKLFQTSIIILIAIGAIKLLKMIVEKSLKSTKFDQRKTQTLSSVFNSVGRYLIYFFAIFQILSLFISNMSSFLAVAGVGSVALGFGAQSLVRDMLSGLFILFEDQYGVGDVVTIRDKTGVVENIGLRSTRIRSTDGSVHLFSNGTIDLVTNMSKDYLRAIINLPIKYDQDVDHVTQVVSEVVMEYYKEGHGIINPPNILGITSFDDFSFNFRVTIDCEIGANWTVERELRKRLMIRFNEEQIILATNPIIIN